MLRNYRNSKFPGFLNLSDIIPVYKKLDPSDQADYRPVSFLPLSLKVIIYDQLYEYMKKLKLCLGYYVVSKKYIPRYIDSGDYAGAILIDFSKAYLSNDYLSQELLIVKLEAYGFDIGNLNFLLYNISLREHRTIVVSSCCKCSEICRGIPQGSILGLLLLNLFIKYISFFVEKSEICNFADGNTIYS